MDAARSGIRGLSVEFTSEISTFSNKSARDVLVAFDQSRPPDLGRRRPEGLALMYRNP
jgi:hypothetical protein